MLIQAINEPFMHTVYVHDDGQNVIMLHRRQLTSFIGRKAEG